MDIDIIEFGYLSPNTTWTSKEWVPSSGPTDRKLYARIKVNDPKLRFSEDAHGYHEIADPDLYAVVAFVCLSNGQAVEYIEPCLMDVLFREAFIKAMQEL